jgi:Uma2 family endonuclease
MDTRIYPPLDVETYLRVEEASPERHEYVAGEMYLMSGGTMRHARLIGRIFTMLSNAVGDRRCDVLFGDLKLRAAPDRIYYPDVMVVCTPVDGDAMLVDEPCVVVEVASPSTHRIDRVEKLDTYRQLPSLRTYLMVEQRTRSVEHWWRGEHDAWQHATITGATDGRIPIACLDTTLTLAEIYRGIDVQDHEER